MPKPGLRILALVTDAFGGHGGIAQYNRDLLAALAGCEGVGEVIVLPRAGERQLDTPVGVRQLRPVGSRIVYSLEAMRLALTQRPIDVVFCGHLFMAPLAAIVAKFLNARLWIQVHGVEAWRELPRLQRWSVETADLVTSVSRHTRRQLLRWVGIDSARVKVLPNTVDPRYQPGPKPHHLIERHAVVGKRILLSVSRLASSERYKGQDRVIQSLPRLLRERPDIAYLVVGEGDDRPRLEALARECGVAEQVRFVGAVNGEEMPDYFRLADVFVMPSTGEGFGIVFLEAIATGIPVIAGNQDGSRDALRDGVYGTLVDPDDGDELAAGISSALDKPAGDGDRAARFGQDLFAEHIEGLSRSIALVQPATSLHPAR